MPKSSFQIEKNQQLLMVRPIGAWSEQLAIRYIQNIDQYLAESQADFAGFIDLRQWELGTPAALKVISENDVKAIAMGYKLEFHYGNPLALSMQISRQQITPQGLNLYQTTDLQLVQTQCQAFGYQFDLQVLKDFLDQ